MKEGVIFLREQGRACFSMSLINEGINGVEAAITTSPSEGRRFQKTMFQFDDGFAAEGNCGQTTTIMLEALRGQFQRRIPKFSKIGEEEIIWVRDSRQSDGGPAPGFLAFQKRVKGGMTQILCMGMKREFPDMPDDSHLFTPTAVFVPQGQVPVTSDYPHIMTPSEEWTALEYMIARFYQVQKKGNFPSLKDALNNSQRFFRDPLEPHRHEEIKKVFGIE